MWTNKPKIGFDFNGVLGATAELKSYVAKQKYGVDIPPHEFKKEWVIGTHLTHRQYRQVQKAVFTSEEYGLLMRPLPGSRQVLRLLEDAGFELYILSSRPRNAERVAEMWLDKYFSHLKRIEFIGIEAGESKSPVAKNLKTLAYMDDETHKLYELKNIVPYLFLMSWQDNEGVDLKPINAERVCNFYHFYRFIKTIYPDIPPLSEIQQQEFENTEPLLECR